MRWIVFALMLALSSWGANAGDFGKSEDSSAEPPMATAEGGVVVTPIPAPAPVIERLKDVRPTSELRPAKKLKLAKKKPLPTLLLSRTERHQMALLADKQKTDGPSLLGLFNDEDAESGAENLDLHRSYSRPKVIKVADQDEEDQDPDLSDTVKLRLFLARMKAVQAHQKKFS